jgi:uncharacterized protein YegL
MDLVRLAGPWVLLAALPAWAAILYASLSPASRRGGAAVRAALLCAAAGLLAAALAGPEVRVGRPDAACAVLVRDASASMQPEVSAPQSLAAAARALPAGRVGLVTFAARPRTVVEPLTAGAADFSRDPARVLAARADPAASAEAGDLAAALEHAAAVLPQPDGLLLLYTDARETRPGAVAAAARLAASGVRVHALMPALPEADVRVDRIAPVGAPEPGRPAAIDVQVSATRAAEVVVRVPPAAPGADMTRRIVLAAGGTAVVRFDVGPLPVGLHPVAARIVAADGPDAWPGNDAARCLLSVGPPRSVVYAHGSAGPSPVREAVLHAMGGGSVIRTVPSPHVADSLNAGVALVVLDNVSAWSLGTDAAAGLARRVTDGGMGLLAVGGDASFGAGGYADSPLDALLPLSSRLGERPPVDLVLVVDASGSMNEAVGAVTKLALAKQAVFALRPALGSADRVGIVAFAGEAQAVSPLVGLAAWPTLRERLLALRAGGGTRITPAVRMALEMLPAPRPGDRTVRHVLLLGDGRSADFDLAPLEAAARARGASVSAVATGADADLERLGRLAAVTGGRLYGSGDLGRLADAFLKDLAWARGDGLIDKPSPAAWRASAPVWPASGAALPAAPAHNPTRPQQGADIHWACADAGAGPLLATWRRGAGKAAAMPLAAGEDAAEWFGGDAGRARLAPLVEWLSGQTAPEDWSAAIVDTPDGPAVRITLAPAAIGESAAAADAPAFRVAAFPQPSNTPAVTATQVAPGVYEAALPGDRGAAPGGEGDMHAGEGVASVVVHREDAGQAARLPVPGRPPAEFRATGVDRANLEAIVRAGGGRIHDTPQSVVQALAQVETRGYRPVGLLLVAAAGAAVLALVALRLLGRL